MYVCLPLGGAGPPYPISSKSVFPSVIKFFDGNSPNFPNGNIGGVLGKGLNDFGESGYGGPAPPNGRHTYIFKGYTLDSKLNLKEGYSKQYLEDAMKGHIIAEARLTGTFTP